MTLAIVIARKNDFIIIADSRVEGKHPADSTKRIYHDQEQKVFHSSAQRIGLCIAGNAVLIHNNPNFVNDPDKQIFTSFVVREYFSTLDNRGAGQLCAEDLYGDINDYVNNKYPDYLTSFKQVSLFYGGFDKNNNTEIYSWHKSVLNSFKYADDFSSNNKVCAFSNCRDDKSHEDLVHHLTRLSINDSETKDYFKDNFSLNLNASNEIENQNMMLCYQNFNVPLSGLIPAYRKSIHDDYGRETYIGEHFDCYKINSHVNSVPNTHLTYCINNLSKELEPHVPAFKFNYSTAKTPNDLEQDRLSGRLSYFDHAHSPLVFSQQPPTPF